MNIFAVIALATALLLICQVHGRTVISQCPKTCRTHISTVCADFGDCYIEHDNECLRRQASCAAEKPSKRVGLEYCSSGKKCRVFFDAKTGKDVYELAPSP